MTNSSTSSAAVLVVAMMLSSGVCFSDAFSTIAPPSLLRLRSTTQQPPQQPLYYAPRNSFDRESERPKRRPGRPRKADSTSATIAETTTSRKSSRSGTVAAAVQKKSISRTRRSNPKRKTTVTVAFQNANTDGTTRQQQQQQRIRTKIRSPSSSQKQRSAISKKTDMLSHELLTKEEEQELFRRMRRAMEVQETMTAWAEANTKERLEDSGQAPTISRSSSSAEESPEDEMEEDEDNGYSYAYNELFGSIDYNGNDRVDGLSQAQQQLEEDEADFGESNLYNELMYGTSNQRAIEQYLAQAEEVEDLFYQDGTLFQVNEDESYGAYSPGYPVPQQKQQQEHQPEPVISTKSWLDDLLLKDGDESSSSWLTDENILEALDLSGGRGELRTILLEGALAREKLISSNFKLAMGIAAKWAGSDSLKSVGGSAENKKQFLVEGSYLKGNTNRPSMDEALHEGVLGLAEAAERFDPDRGFKFSTYATFWVTNYIRRLYHRESTQGIRLPDNYYDYKRKYTNLVKSYMRSPGAEVPPMDILASELGLTESRLINIVRMTRPMVSMDASMHLNSEEAGGEMYNLASLLPCDEPAPEDYVERSFLRQCLENAMAVECTPSERDILRLRLGLDDGEPRTANEVALVYGGALSAAAVRVMEKKAFKKLRSPYAVHSQKLLAYLDFAGIDRKEALSN